MMDNFKWFLEENGVLILSIIIGTVIGHGVAKLIGL